MQGPGTAVRVRPSRQRADEWAVVLAAAGTPHWLRRRLDGWAVIVPPDDAPPPWRVSPPTTRRTPERALRLPPGVGLARDVEACLLAGFLLLTRTDEKRVA